MLAVPEGPAVERADGVGLLGEDRGPKCLHPHPHRQLPLQVRQRGRNVGQDRCSRDLELGCRQVELELRRRVQDRWVVICLPLGAVPSHNTTGSLLGGRPPSC